MVDIIVREKRLRIPVEDSIIAVKGNQISEVTRRGNYYCFMH